ncbi:hypothetical protein AWENTII_002898 [Aspergillus wentii]|nr:hypothetical protein MW887_007549 [Aspergillus wentii]
MCETDTSILLCTIPQKFLQRTQSSKRSDLVSFEAPIHSRKGAAWEIQYDFHQALTSLAIFASAQAACDALEIFLLLPESLPYWDMDTRLYCGPTLQDGIYKLSIHDDRSYRPMDIPTNRDAKWPDVVCFSASSDERLLFIYAP